MSRSKNNLVFDPIYGFIQVTPVEWEIIHSPFYQRLKWIKQLGFSFYVFPGAEHSRFGHSIGVMNNAQKMLEAIGKAVPHEELLDPKCMNKEAVFHKSIRLAALMHDLGTFMFSHTTEGAYVRYGETTNKKSGKGLSDNHEHLGSYIIKNTNYSGGITHILNKYGFDPQRISYLVKGMGEDILANQILHSEIDCDRMDYLLRDAHYTGLKYGAYDRDYLLHHFKTANIGGVDVLTIKEGALHCVEDFLMARFAWYSQVIRSARGAKYDAIAEEITFFLIKNGLIYRYGELLDLIAGNPIEFYRFNDMYFIETVHKHFVQGAFNKDKKIYQLAESILFEISPVSINCKEFNSHLLSQDDTSLRAKQVKRAEDKISEINEVLKKKGSSNDWILTDLPNKDIVFVKSYQQVVKGLKGENILHSRDPVKILFDDGKVKLLAEVENSIIGKIQNTFNFVPNVFCSPSAHELLKKEKIVD
ncbi:MAG: HD domain-containing protein [Bacteriovoracaceae bacterium]|nr:HD domain-containing protein [Bacteriovoracaceae bacterium]